MQTISPAELYDERYCYLSAREPGYLTYLRDSAERLVEERRLDGNSSVIEAGSNDGSMLRFFQARGVPTLGIEPAPAPAGESRRAGIATLSTFFTKDMASKLRSDGRQADVFIANQVLSRVPDLHGFLAGVRKLLTDDGIAVFEVPYVRDMIENGAFDLVGHEQLCYFSVTSLVHLLDSEGLTLNDVERRPVHGGSLRAVVSRSRRVEPSVGELIEAEASAGVSGIEYYTGFGWRAELTRGQLRALLGGLRRDEKRIVGCGAASSASTMLNYCRLDGTYLDYVVDLNPRRQGRFVPGVQLPVLSPDRLLSNRPDYVLLLSHGACAEMLSQHDAYRRNGGHVIVPIPKPAILV
jgi:hypothetical protein